MGFATHKLEQMEKRYRELESLLCSSDILADSNKVRDFSVERASLEETVNTYAEYQDVCGQLLETQTLLKKEQEQEFYKYLEEELTLLQDKKQQLEEGLTKLLLPKDPHQGKNVLMEIRAGTGGEEAALFAAELVRMYTRYAERKNWKVELMNMNATGLGGIKEAILSIQGKEAWSSLKFESGVHRVQRVPATEAGGRIHTSTVTVAVLPEAEEFDVVINEKDLHMDTFRASGAGGQYVNKTESAVRITHIPTGIVVACQDERSQHQNRDKALRILRAHLFEIKQQQQEEAQGKMRRQQVGTGERSEKIRTYNFPQSRITDHRISRSVHSIQDFLDGGLDDLTSNLQEWDKEEKLKETG